MNYQELHSISNVKTFAVSNNKIAYVRNRDFLIFDWNNEKNIFSLKNPPQDLFFKNDAFYLNDIEGNGYFIEDFNVRDFSKFILALSQKKEVILIEEGSTFIFDMSKNEIVKEITVRSLVFICSENHFFFRPKKNIIICVSYQTGSTQWQKDVSNEFKINSINGSEYFAEVAQYIYASENIVWVFLSTGDVVGLESSTGRLLYRTGEVTSLNFTGKDQYLIADAGMRISKIKYYHDNADNKIKGMFFRGYAEMDLNSPNPQINFWAIEDQMVAYGLKEIHFEIAIGESDDIYFMDINSFKWGIFNTRTKTIAYVSEKITIPDRPDAFTQLKQIKYAGGKVFVLDSNRTLHIFEKEID
jgi:hypothetical protein